MSRVPLIDPDATTGAVSDTMTQIRDAFGVVPNMFRAVANSPAALSSMWTSFGAFGTGALGAALGEQVAVAVANRNRCDYCLSAHTALGRKAGVSQSAMGAAQVGESEDEAVAVLLRFALDLVEERGQVSAADVERVRAAGWTDEQIVEVIAQVALNLFTNYINVALDVPVDFPKVSLRAG